jgi:hypothetical protein
MATTFNLEDKSNLKDAVVWVAGWINGGPATAQYPTGLLALHANGTFETPPQVTNPQQPGPATVPGVPFHRVSALKSFKLSVATNGNDRLVFVVAPTSSGQPRPLLAPGLLPMQYAAYPYLGQPAPWVYPPGPFDILEFGLNAGVDVSAVNGFGLNLSFIASPTPTPPVGAAQFGVRQSMPRRAIGEAYKTFIASEVKRLPKAQAFASLLYDKALGSGPTPPMVDKQFFAISDPNDWLVALTSNYRNMADHHLVNYWNGALVDFFTVGQWLSLNISSGAPNIYSGQCSLQTNPNRGVTSPAYTLKNDSTGNSYTFYMPTAAEGQPPGLMGAKYVFKQAYDELTPAGAGGDAGTLQDSIWQALCRGVAYLGASETRISNGESTAIWNDPTKWYLTDYVSDVYAKFLHCSDIAGGDWRTSGKPSLFYGGSAYGFSEDETPDGPYSGPPNTVQAEAYVPDGWTVTITVGPWW